MEIQERDVPHRNHTGQAGVPSTRPKCQSLACHRSLEIEPGLRLPAKRSLRKQVTPFIGVPKREHDRCYLSDRDSGSGRAAKSTSRRAKVS